MKAFTFRTTEDIKRVLVCLFFLVSLVFSSSCQEKVKVVVNKSATELAAEKFTGVAEEYDSSGSIVSRISYEDGIRHGEYWFYHRNGNVEYNGFRLSGSLDGEIKKFEYDGSLFSISTYEDGVALRTYFYRDGKPFVMRDFHRKIEYIYNREGEIVSERYYGKGME